MNRPFKNLQIPRKKTAPLIPSRNWSVVKTIDGKVARNVFVSLTRVEAEGAAKAGNAHLNRRGISNIRYKILEDALPVR